MDSRTEYSTKKNYVADHLRELIISGELRPGTRLRQQDIADQFGMSATPVREAIQQLETEGFLLSTPHVGVQVAETRQEDLEEVYEIRSILEGRMAAEAVKNVTPSDISWLREACDDFAEAVNKGAFVEARRINYSLHRRIWELADQPISLEIVNALWAKFPWDILDYVPGRGDRSIDEHAGLVDALEANDADGARLALKAHIRSGHKDFMASRPATGNNE